MNSETVEKRHKPKRNLDFTRFYTKYFDSSECEHWNSIPRLTLIPIQDTVNSEVPAPDWAFESGTKCKVWIWVQYHDHEPGNEIKLKQWVRRLRQGIPLAFPASLESSMSIRNPNPPPQTPTSPNLNSWAQPVLPIRVKNFGMNLPPGSAPESTTSLNSHLPPATHPSTVHSPPRDPTTFVSQTFYSLLSLIRP